MVVFDGLDRTRDRGTLQLLEALVKSQYLATEIVDCEEGFLHLLTIIWLRIPSGVVRSAHLCGTLARFVTDIPEALELYLHLLEAVQKVARHLRLWPLH